MVLLESTGQWRIQDFPEVGGDNSKIGVILQFLKERIWNPGGGDPPMQGLYNQVQSRNLRWFSPWSKGTAVCGLDLQC